MLYEQPEKTEQIIISIYENLIILQNELRKINPFAFGKVSGEVMGHLNGESLVVLEFPKPFDLPLAKYGAIYINKSKREYQYLTLEFSLNSKFVLGSMTKERHFNYGQLDDLSKEDFIHEVFQKVCTNEATLLPRNMICRRHMLELNDHIFKDVIANSPYFCACFYDFNEQSQLMLPILEQLAQEYKDKIIVGVYDVYGGFENISVCEHNNIIGMPTFILFKDGQEVKRHIGIAKREYLKIYFH